MEKRSQHLALFTLCIFFGSGLGAIHLASAGGQWCVAKKGASDTALQTALEYACGVTDCSAIQPGAICYNPNTVQDHASYAFNEYYQNKPESASCVFGGVATLTSKDPSHGSCKYASSGTSTSPSTPGSPPSKPTSILSTPNQSTHGRSPAQPTITPPPSPGQEASPSGATSTSYSLLVFLACGLLASLQVAKSI